MWSGALISALVGTELPGPGTIYLGQSLRFHRPVCIGDTVTVTATVKKKCTDVRRVTLDCLVRNQRSETVISGTAEVIAPTEKVSRPRTALPQVALFDKGRHHQALIERCHGLKPLRTAIVHPVDEASLVGAVEAGRQGLIIPALVGPEAKIRSVAERADVDLSAYTLVATEHSHAAAAEAVAMARTGEVEAVMKGALHTDELMHAVVAAEGGLRTDRRISHAFSIDAPF
jgi:acyl-CoA hydrolase